MIDTPKNIRNNLGMIERIYNVKILYAVESGSRSWGFASQDSDWDVRFIYVHHPEWYLSISTQKDVIEEMLPGDLDFAGWDIKKALGLFQKSNPSLMEWLQSPIVYKNSFDTHERMLSICSDLFHLPSILHHYIHMAEGNYREYLQGDLVRIKKYFYVLRPVLAGLWIVQRLSMPPIEFSKLVEAGILDTQLHDLIQDLLKRKVQGDELDIEPKIDALNNFLDTQISYLKEYAQKISYEKVSNSDIIVDTFFIETLKKVWDFNI